MTVFEVAFAGMQRNETMKRYDQQLEQKKAKVSFSWASVRQSIV